MGWSQSVVISQLIVQKILLSDSGLPIKEQIKEGSSHSNFECRFGRYIDEISLIGWNRREVRKLYYPIFGALTRHSVSPKPSKRKRPTTKPVKVLGLEVHSQGTVQVVQEKMNALLGITHQMIQAHIWNANKLKQVLGSRKWFLFLNKPVMSVLHKCYELSTCDKHIVLASLEAKHEFMILTSLAPLLHAFFYQRKLSFHAVHRCLYRIIYRPSRLAPMTNTYIF